VVQYYSYKIYFVIFGHSYKFLRILEVCTIFWELKHLKNDLKTLGTVLGRNSPWSYSARHGGRPEGRMSHDLAAQSSCEAAHVLLTPGALRRGHRAQSARGTGRWLARRQSGDG
jgi:hypothetical protein